METINHEYYVSLEVAKLLEKAGFGLVCRDYYYPSFITSQYRAYAKPTLDVTQRWLREEKGMILNITFDARTNKNHSYSYDGVWYKNGFVIQYFGMVTNYVDGYPHGFETYEQALESCIQICLTILLKEK